MSSLLGMELQVDQLQFNPCFPEEWPAVSIQYRYKTTTYEITIYQKKDMQGSWWKMGKHQGKGNTIALKDDGKKHQAEVHILI